jgi:hypothetical protein
MRRDTSEYTIKTEWNQIDNEFISTFTRFVSETYGAGDTKAEAVINLIANSKDWELEQ